MATPTTVNYGLDTPAALPRAGVAVTATLVGAGDRSDDVGVVGGSVTVTTDLSGAFSLSLLPNSAYEQLSTYYAVNIDGGPSYNIVVPVGGPVDLWDIRVDPRTLTPVPATVPPVYLARAERGAVLGVASLDATGKVPTAQLPVGGGSVPDSRVLTAGVGLSGGGDLSADRTFDVEYGDTAGTACEGDDSRLSPGIADVTGLTAALAGKETAGAAAAAIAAHVGAADPHPQYLTATEGNAAYDALGAGSTAAAAAMGVHLAAGDPHPQYLTAAEGGAAFDALGAAAAAVAAHKVETDAHAISRITGLQTALDAKIAASLVDVKGDLLVATAADTVTRLAAGADTHVLTADSAQAAGVKWAALPPGGEQECYGPGAAGFDEWSCDPLLCSTTFATASGTLILVRHRFRKTMTIDEIGFVLQQTGTVPGAYSGVAVYDDGTGTVNRLAQSADAGSVFGTLGERSIALTAGVSVSAGAFRWIGYLWQGSTPPRLYAPPGPAGAEVFNVGRRRSVFLSAQTGFPASLDVSTMTANTTTYWFSFKDV